MNEQATIKNLTIDLKELAANHFKYLQMSKSVYESRLPAEERKNIAALVDVQRSDLESSVIQLMQVESYTHVLQNLTVKEYQENEDFYNDKVHSMKKSLVAKYNSYLNGLGDL